MSLEVIDIHAVGDSRDIVHRAVQALAEEKLVAFPTETVYGLAASALCPGAIEQLNRVKGRTCDQPLTLAVKSAGDALDYVPDMLPLAQRLARRCWPGPITLVVDDSHEDSLLKRLPESVQQRIAPAGTVGLRVPAHQAILDVLQMLVGPLALTSANRGGQPDAITADQVVNSLGDEVDLLLDDGRSRYGQPSSVLRVNNGKQLEILREGVVPEATIRRLSSFMILLVCTGNTCRSPMAEVLTRKLLAGRLRCHIDDLDEHGVIVMSAGIAAMAGGCPSPQAVRVMGEMGLDLVDHRSQLLTEQLVRHADVIFTMTSAHRKTLVGHWPTAAARTHLVCHNSLDITDPIGGALEVYRLCAKHLESELKFRLDKLDIT